MTSIAPAMFSPSEIATFQDILDAVEPPIQTRNGVLTRKDIQKLRQLTEQEASRLTPNRPTPTENQVNRPPMEPEATEKEREQRTAKS
jgi:hypothetical protein